MDYSTQSFLLNVGFIIRESTGYSRIFEFDVPRFKFDPDLELKNISGTMTIIRSSEGLLSQGAFDASTEAVCVRCLESFSQPITIEFTELYAFPSRIQEDTELIVPAEGKINFAPLLREYILLTMPINPICQDSCPGLCPVSGINLNNGQCNHETIFVDPRLAILKQFLDKK